MSFPGLRSRRLRVAPSLDRRAAERLSHIDLGDGAQAPVGAHLEAERLSYLVSLGAITGLERKALAPLLPAVEAFLEQAQRMGSAP